MTYLNYKVLGVIALIGVIYLTGVYSGYRYEHAKFTAFKDNIEFLAKQQEALITSVKKQQTLITKGVKDDYESKLAAVHAYYDGLLDNSRSDRMPSVPNTPRNVNENASYYRLAKSCAATTIQLTSLQKWIKGQLDI